MTQEQQRSALGDIWAAIEELRNRDNNKVLLGELIAVDPTASIGTYAIVTNYQGAITQNTPFETDPENIVTNVIMTAPRWGRNNYIQHVPTVKSVPPLTEAGEDPEEPPTRGEFALLITLGYGPLQGLTFAIAYPKISSPESPILSPQIAEQGVGVREQLVGNKTTVVVSAEDEPFFNVFGLELFPEGPYITVQQPKGDDFGELQRIPLPILNPFHMFNQEEEIGGVGSDPITGYIPIPRIGGSENPFDAMTLGRDSTLELMSKAVSGTLADLQLDAGAVELEPEFLKDTLGSDNKGKFVKIPYLFVANLPNRATSIDVLLRRNKGPNNVWLKMVVPKTQQEILNPADPLDLSVTKDIYRPTATDKNKYGSLVTFDEEDGVQTTISVPLQPGTNNNLEITVQNSFSRPAIYTVIISVPE